MIEVTVTNLPGIAADDPLRNLSEVDLNTLRLALDLAIMRLRGKGSRKYAAGLLQLRDMRERVGIAWIERA